MEIASSAYGSILTGRVIETKSGSGKAETTLTIITYSDIDDNTEKKLLCWNSERSPLADRARAFKPNDVFVARAEIDQGDNNIATAFELKAQGLFRLKDEKDKPFFVVSGKVAKVTNGKNVQSIMIPVNFYNGNQKETRWYRVSFWNKLAINDIKKGDRLAVRGCRLREVTYNGFTYQDLTGLDYRKL